MNCQEIEKYCLDYCDNNLSPELRASFDEHLQQCNNCRNLVDLTHLESEALSDPVDIPALSPDFNTRLMDRIQAKGMLYPDQEAKPETQYQKYLFNRPYVKRSWAMLAAALLLVLLIPPILKQGLYDQQPGLINGVKTVTLPQNTNTKIEKTSLEKNNNKPLNQDTSQLKSASPADNNNMTYGNQDLKLKLPNQEIPLAAHQPQELVPGNGSSREVNKSSLNSRLQTSHDEGLAPYPDNIPASYELVQKNESNGQYIYQYRESGTNIELCIIITPLLQQQISAASMDGEASEAPETAVTENYQMSNTTASTTEPPASMLNSCNKSISSDNINYNLTVSGNLPQEKIEAIASTITLSQK